MLGERSAPHCSLHFIPLTMVHYTSITNVNWAERGEDRKRTWRTEPCEEVECQEKPTAPVQMVQLSPSLVRSLLLRFVCSLCSLSYAPVFAKTKWVEGEKRTEHELGENAGRKRRGRWTVEKEQQQQGTEPIVKRTWCCGECYVLYHSLHPLNHSIRSAPYSSLHSFILWLSERNERGVERQAKWIERTVQSSHSHSHWVRVSFTSCTFLTLTNGQWGKVGKEQRKETEIRASNVSGREWARFASPIMGVIYHSVLMSICF